MEAILRIWRLGILIWAWAWAWAWVRALGLGLWAWALALGVGLGLGLGLDFSKKGHMNRNQKKTSISKKRVLPISTLDYGLLILQLDSAAQLLF